MKTCCFDGVEDRLVSHQTLPDGLERKEPVSLGYPVGKVDAGIRFSSEGGREEMIKAMVVSNCLM